MDIHNLVIVDIQEMMAVATKELRMVEVCRIDMNIIIITIIRITIIIVIITIIIAIIIIRMDIEEHLLETTKICTDQGHQLVTVAVTVEVHLVVATNPTNPGMKTICTEMDHLVDAEFLQVDVVGTSLREIEMDTIIMVAVVVGLAHLTGTTWFHPLEIEMHTATLMAISAVIIAVLRPGKTIDTDMVREGWEHRGTATTCHIQKMVVEEVDRHWHRVRSLREC